MELGMIINVPKIRINIADADKFDTEIENKIRC